MTAFQRVIIAYLAFISVCLLLASCGQFQAKDVTLSSPGSPPATQQAQAGIPEPVSTYDYPPPLPVASQPVPMPIETMWARVTEGAESRLSSATHAAVVATAQQQTAQALIMPLLEKDYGSWGFNAYRYRRSPEYPIDPEVQVGLHYDKLTVSSLKALALSHQELVHKLAAAGAGRQVEASIIFRTYISPEKFNAWASAVGLHPTYTELRVVYECEKGYVCPSDDFPYEIPPPAFRAAKSLQVLSELGDAQALPKRRLESALAKQQDVHHTQHYKLREMKGVYLTFVTIDAQQLAKIADDPLVFMVDITHDWVQYELEVAGVSPRENLRMLGGLLDQYKPPSLFEFMEKSDLDMFAK
jgi:hypothetical protein